MCKIFYFYTHIIYGPKQTKNVTNVTSVKESVFQQLTLLQICNIVTFSIFFLFSRVLILLQRYKFVTSKTPVFIGNVTIVTFVTLNN